MKAVMMVLSVESIPVGVFAVAVRACPLCRRPWFWLRVAAVVVAILLPALVAIGAPLPSGRPS